MSISIIERFIKIMKKIIVNTVKQDYFLKANTGMKSSCGPYKMMWRATFGLRALSLTYVHKLLKKLVCFINVTANQPACHILFKTLLSFYQLQNREAKSAFVFLFFYFLATEQIYQKNSIREIIQKTISN